MSVLPPAPKPTRMRTGFDGKVCAAALLANEAIAKPMMTDFKFMLFPLQKCGHCVDHTLNCQHALWMQ
jgi:hypothetical protein